MVSNQATKIIQTFDAENANPVYRTQLTIKEDAGEDARRLSFEAPKCT